MIFSIISYAYIDTGKLAAQQIAARAKINPESWERIKILEIDYCYPVGEAL